MKKFVIVGLGRFGASLALSIAEKGFQVLAIDNDEQKVAQISEVIYNAVQADVTEKETLSSLKVQEYDTAVASIGENVQANILATLFLKDLGVPYVIAKAQDENFGKVYAKIGADRVIYPERDMGQRLGQNLLSSNLIDYIKFDSDYSVVELRVTSAIEGRSLRELDLRKKYNINVIAIRTGEKLNFSPGADDTVREDDILIVMGKNKDIDQIKDMEKSSNNIFWQP